MAGKRFLAQLADPWLLIIDDAGEADSHLHDLLPPGNAAHILVTTRIRDFCNNQDTPPLEVQELEADDALHLLLTSAGIPPPWGSWTEETGNEIIKTLGYLALAVAQAGNCISRGICKLDEYLDLHHGERHVLRQRQSDDGWSNGPRNWETSKNPVLQAVYTSFDASYKILLRRPTVRHEDALDLLRLCSFLHFENVPVEMLWRAIENRVHDLKQPSKMSRMQSFVCALTSRLEPPKLLPSFLRGELRSSDRYRINWAISDLRNVSLITCDGRYISLHPLVHEWARADLTATEREVWASIALNTLLESISLSGDTKRGPSSQFHQDVLPHVEKCLDGRESQLLDLAANSSQGQIHLAKVFQPTLVMILRNQILNAAKFGWFFAERGAFGRASKMLETVRDAQSRLLGDDHERTGVAMLDLAAAYLGSGRLDEAIVLQRAVVESRSRLFGSASQQTIQAMNHLGQSYWLSGHYVEALELQQTAIDGMRAIVDVRDTEYLDKLSALDNLGLIFGAWRRYAESRDLHQEVLEARKKILGELHTDTLTTKAHLAMTFLGLGELEMAMSHISEVYRRRKEQLGEEHPWTLLALCFVAKVNIEAGCLEEAERLLVWGLEAGLRRLPPKHFGILKGRGELARVYVRQGRYAEAKRLMEQVLQSTEGALGPAHPDCVVGLLRSAQLYIRTDERTKATRACKDALERVDMRLTREHPLSIQLDHMLGVLEDPQSTASDLARLVPESSQPLPNPDATDAISSNGTC